MKNYKGFKVGQKVMLNESGIHNGQHIDKGTEFIIKSFPPKTFYKGHGNMFFVFGHTDTGAVIRAEIEQIIDPLK